MDEADWRSEERKPKGSLLRKGKLSGVVTLWALLTTPSETVKNTRRTGFHVGKVFP